MDLQLSDDIDQQRRDWIFERIGWVLLAAALFAALAGLFGPGIFGTARASAADGTLSVEYLRFVRARSPQELRVIVEPQNNGDSRFQVWIDSAYVDALSLERVTPQPDTVHAGAQRMTFEFAWDGAPGQVPITFEIEPREAGRLRARIGVDTSAAEIRQFVYP